MTRRIVSILIMIIIALFVQNNGALFAQNNDENYKNLLKKAEKAVDEGEKEKSYYYITRYIGLVMYDQSTKMKVEDIKKVVDKIGLKSTAFISGKYSPEFLEWYFMATYYMWASPEEYTNEAELATVLAPSLDNKYYIGIVAHPVMESWAIIGTPDGKIKNSYIHLIDYKKPPKIVVGNLKKTNQEILEYELNPGNELYYQYFWRPVLKDLNNDGNTEIILRYNFARADGFYQKCDVYTISGTKIKFLDSITGDPEGFARYISGNEFETGHALPSSSEIGHMGYDLYEIKKYRFVNNKFKETQTEKPVQHILWTDKFKKYFYEAGN